MDTRRILLLSTSLLKEILKKITLVEGKLLSGQISVDCLIKDFEKPPVCKNCANYCSTDRALL